MRRLGFETLLEDCWLSPIIVTFISPADPAFSFARFYELMKASGLIIYPGKLTEVDSFRIGCIGAIDETVMGAVVNAVGRAMVEMGIAPTPAPAGQPAISAQA
jgi:2-aminoethylphosphonate-pyruvate transaminase